MKFIDSKMHGIIDYLYVIFLLAAPALFNLSDFTASYAYVLAGLAFVVTILTDFEVGIFKVIPFPIHGIIDLFMGILLVISPWLFNFAVYETDRNLFLVLGFVVLLVFTFTRFRQPIEQT
ncbi:MAG: hypothetical protein WD059_13515 [Balneolaceae bacterium]